jgi:hypothetical protein
MSIVFDGNCAYKERGNGTISIGINKIINNYYNGYTGTLRVRLISSDQ